MVNDWTTRWRRGRSAAVLLVTVLICAASPLVRPVLAEAAAPSLFSYAGFNDPSDSTLALNGTARVSPPILQLSALTSSPETAGAAWRVDKVEVAAGWQTRFTWQLSAATGDSAEGLAFVIQNDSLTADGGAGDSMGFAGISDSLAVEIDTNHDASTGDPYVVPFISVQTRGVSQNSSDVTYSLGAAGDAALGDGNPHVLTVRYLPGQGAGDGLAVFVDDAATPALTVPSLDLTSELALSDGQAWVGFTSSNSDASLADADITSWSFGPAATPAQLVITSPALAGVVATQPNLGPATVTLTDGAGHALIAPTALAVGLQSNSPEGVFAASSEGSPVSLVTIGQGRSSAQFWYGDSASGTPTITATGSGLASATQIERLNPGAAAALRLNPAIATIAAGGSQAYTVTALDAFGNTIGADPKATVSITPDGACTGATCTATSPGVHTVTATDGSLAATSSLTVQAGKASSLSLDPATATITAGGSQAYTVTSFDAYGNRIGADPDASFSISPDGSCTGGACTAKISGTHTVRATDGSLTGTATLTVQPGSAEGITIGPATATIIAGTSQTFTVVWVDGFGNQVSPDSNATLWISPDGSCSAATCTAQVAGTHTVNVSEGSLTATATLTVQPGKAASLGLNPASATITAGSSQTYVVTAVDAYGNPIGPDSNATFSITPDGTCTTGSCTAQIAGPHTVHATDGSLTVTGSLTVKPGPAASLRLSPAAATITIDSRQTYTALGFDRYGNPVGDLTSATTFTIAGGKTNGAQASCKANTCTAQAPGSYLVTGNDGSLTATASLTVVRRKTG